MASGTDIYAFGSISGSGRLSWWLRKSPDSGTFYVFDEYSTSLQGTNPKKIIKEVSGSILCCGQTGSLGIIRKYETFDNNAWLIRYSADNGTSWFDKPFSIKAGLSDRANDVEIDSNNKIYVVGYNSGTSTERNWIVKSSPDGSIWTDCDSYTLGTDTLEEAKTIAIDNNNIIYVAGYESSSAGFKNWIIRSSSDGSNWKTVDFFSSAYISGSEDVACGITTDSNNNVFVVGYTTGSNNVQSILVRKSTTGKSSSFSTVDTYNCNGLKTVATAIDAYGTKLYLVGDVTGSTQYQEGLMRRSLNGGTTWENYDFFGAAPSSSFYKNIRFDSSGSIYTCGQSASLGFVKKYKFLQSPGFNRTQYSGDTKYDKYDPNTGLNFKNEYAKKELLGWEVKKYPNAEHSGVFMNNKLDGPFVIPSIDTSKDSSHWEGDHRRVIKMTVWGLTSSFFSGNAWHNDVNINVGSEIYLTGANGTELSMSLFDETYELVDTGSYYHKIAGVTAATVAEKFNPYLTFYVSSSAQAFNRAEFKVMFRDSNSSAWTNYKDIVPFSMYFTESNKYGQITGWYKFEYNFFSGSLQQIPRFSSLRNNGFLVVSASSAKTYAFKDFKFTYDLPLADTGVEYFRSLDNKNIEEKFINYNVLKDIED